MTQLGTWIDESADGIRFDGKSVRPGQGNRYILLNKPAGYLVTSSDPQGRHTVFDLIRDVPGRVFAVGRLDLDTQGVLLFTDDGALASRLMHPKHQVVKIYRALVKGIVDPEDLSRLVKGIPLEDGVSGVRTARLLEQTAGRSVLLLELITGKKRQVKRMLAALGHPVIGLERISFAGLTADGLDVGQWRYLTENEIAGLISIQDQDVLRRKPETA